MHFGTIARDSTVEIVVFSVHQCLFVVTDFAKIFYFNVFS